MLFIRSLGSGLHLRCLRFPSIVSGMPSRWGRFKACSAGAGASGNAGDGQGQSANPSASANPSGVGASGIANDGSGSANPLPFHCTQDTRESLINYMESCHKGLWHWTLNNTTSTRPKDNGGPTVPSVTKCKAHTQPGPASTSWECVLELPNSFAKDDGIRLRVSAKAPTKMRPTSMLAASRFSISSWRGLGMSFYERPIGESRETSSSRICHALCQRTRLCQYMSTRSHGSYSDPPKVWANVTS